MVRNMGKVDNSSTFSDNDWEEVRRKSNKDIEEWIEKQMKMRSCIVVLIGATTSQSKWVKYEQASASAFTNFYDAFSKDTLTFRQDGTYTQVFEGSTSPINGTYSISNTRLLLGGLFVYDLIFENNNTMIMKEYGYGGDNGIYKFRRLK